ncbi:unnamed protein product [Vitrella brassicaformis CCMP3155]|uniref:Calpain catalytic domain-containing protein n=3 Tax=Vitrella brassicaformis TaxID=1169539 RepID=A0A0G4FZT7_VITBC|nr:unnamed protein product [Vitrella brassicaformis CCMP3155]|eukprot:CEM21054.1 unnamed protein product [Vitrella brassicaformis CCMP3155]
MSSEGIEAADLILGYVLEISDKGGVTVSFAEATKKCLIGYQDRPDQRNDLRQLIDTAVIHGNRSLLHWAVRMGRGEVVSALLSFDLKHHIAKQDDVFKTPLHTVAQTGDMIVAPLVVSAADPSTLTIRDKAGQNCVHCAAVYRQPALVRSLAEAAKLNTDVTLMEDEDGFTPLHLSIFYDCIEITRLLADPRTIIHKGGVGLSALHYGCAKGKWSHVNVMLNAAALGSANTAIATVDEIGRTVLASAICASFAYAGGKDTVLRMVGLLHEKKASHVITARDRDGRIALHHAAKAASRDIVSALCSSEDVKCQDTIWKQTPLHQAAAFGNLSGLDELLKIVDRDALLLRDSASRTALHLAAECGRNECIRMLVKASEEKACPQLLDAVDEDGLLPLHIAIGCDEVEDRVVASLASKERVQCSRKDGQKAYHLAVSRERVTIMQIFLSRFGGDALQAKDNVRIAHLCPWICVRLYLCTEGGHPMICALARALEVTDPEAGLILKGRPITAADQELKKEREDKAFRIQKLLEEAPVSPQVEAGFVVVPSWLRKPKTEKEILEAGAAISGHSFPLWQEKDSDLLVKHHSRSQLYEDPTGIFSLSTRQKEVFAVGLDQFRRFPEAFHPDVEKWKAFPKTQDSISGDKQCCMAKESFSSDCVKQGRLGDCAFLNSLAALAYWEEKTGVPFLRKSIYPKEKAADTEMPVISPEGKYICRLYFNGGARKVVIDDLIPTLTNRPEVRLTGASVIPGETWVTVIEKAYAKTMGGYDAIQGSFAPDNLYMISGWSSEKIELDEVRSKSKDIGHLWEFIYPQLRDRKAVAPRESDDESIPADRKRSDGRFWMEFHEVAENFESLYIAYDPSRFAHRVEKHSRFNVTGQEAFVSSARKISAFSPQFVLEFHPSSTDLATEQVEVWIQLYRHVTASKNVKDAKEKKIGITTQVYEGADRVLSCNERAHVLNESDRRKKNTTLNYCSDSMMRLDKWKLRWWKTEGLKQRSSEDVHLKYNVVVGQMNRKEDFNFTLSVFSNVKVTLKELPPVIPEGWVSQYHDGEWTPETAGGQRYYSSFVTNPKYTVYCVETVESVILLESHQEYTVGLYINNEQRCRKSFNPNSMMLTNVKLAAGETTIIVSTFDPGCIGKYRLSIHTPPMKGDTVYPAVKRV